MPKVIPAERIARSVLVLRGQRVLLDAELAVLYGVAVRREFLVGVKGISRYIRELRHFSVSSEWLHSDRLQQLHCSLLGGTRHRGHLERGAAALTDSRLAGIAHDGGEFVEQRAKAVYG